MNIHNLAKKIKTKINPNITKYSNPLIVAANQRQVRFLRDFIANENIIRSPNICTIDQWIETQWLNFQDAGIDSTDKILIDVQQERYIWEKLLRKESDLPTLIDSDSIAKHIREAYEIVQDHQIPDTKLSPFDDLETQYFLTSRKKFEQYLTEYGLCTASQAFRIIIHTYQIGSVEKYPWACAYGFVEKTAKLEALLEMSAHENFHIEDQAPSNQKVERRSYKDEDEEFQAAANWAKEKLSSSVSNQVVIVVPNLTQV